MKIIISEVQLDKILNEVKYDKTTQNALDCGYRNSDEYEKNNFKCPSKLLRKAKKCGWSKHFDQPTIYRYMASNFRCTPNKKGQLSIDEVEKLKDLMFKYGIPTTPKSIINPTSYMPKIFKNLEKEISDLKDRPDLLKKDYCKPHCISNEVSCFIAVVRNNLSKIKKKLGGGVTNTDIVMLMKIAIALVAWQSNYGKIDKLYDVDTKTYFGIEINPYDVYKIKFGPELLKKYAKSRNVSEPSFGPAEFQISTWDKTGVEELFGYDISSLIGSCLGLMITTWNGYTKAKSLGLSTGPSKNDLALKNGFWPNGIKGTGNHLWDLAISIQTWPQEKMLKKYCKTSSPLFAGPCDQDFYEPFTGSTAKKTWESWKESTPQLISYYEKTKEGFPGKIKVLRNQPILDYYPMLRGSHGNMKSINDSKTILESVSSNLKRYGCVTLQADYRPVVDDMSTKKSTAFTGGLA